MVGEQDLAGIDAADWRQEIVWVPQRPALFNLSVADNIRLVLELRLIRIFDQEWFDAVYTFALALGLAALPPEVDA